MSESTRLQIEALERRRREIDKQIARCRMEIEECEAKLFNGHADIAGAMLGLVDWQHELEILNREVREVENDV